MADRDEAKRGRADARERRREQAPEGAGSSSDASGAPARGQAIEEVKHAAKVAAASAAVGAAVAAARALASRDGEETETQAAAPETEDEAVAHVSEQPAVSHEESTPEEPEAETEREPETQRGQGEEAKARPREEPRAAQVPTPGATPGTAKATVQRAREQLESLLGRTPESVSSFERIREGWVVTLEVVEVSRIPESTDVLASYEMELDEDGNLRRYARVRRYRRSQADNGERS